MHVSVPASTRDAVQQTNAARPRQDVEAWMATIWPVVKSEPSRTIESETQAHDTELLLQRFSSKESHKPVGISREHPPKPAQCRPTSTCAKNNSSFSSDRFLGGPLHRECLLHNARRSAWQGLIFRAVVRARVFESDHAVSGPMKV